MSRKNSDNVHLCPLETSFHLQWSPFRQDSHHLLFQLGEMVPKKAFRRHCAYLLLSPFHPFLSALVDGQVRSVI